MREPFSSHRFFSLFVFIFKGLQSKIVNSGMYHILRSNNKTHNKIGGKKGK
jgi:hypothetical protein